MRMPRSKQPEPRPGLVIVNFKREEGRNFSEAGR